MTEISFACAVHENGTLEIVITGRTRELRVPISEREASGLANAINRRLAGRANERRFSVGCPSVERLLMADGNPMLEQRVKAAQIEATDFLPSYPDHGRTARACAERVLAGAGFFELLTERDQLRERAERAERALENVISGESA